MPEEIDVVQDPSPETVVETPTDEVAVETEAVPEKPAEKVVPYQRFKSVNDELAKLKSQPVKVINKALDVEDYIDISASLEGLDQREKAYLAKEHKLTGRPLSEIRKDEDFTLWQDAWRAKVEKERQTLAPNSTQMLTDAPRSFEDRINSAPDLASKEALLVEAGLYRAPKLKQDRVNIGTQR